MNSSLHITETGTGPRLIMLHGFLANSSLWTQMNAILSKHFTLCCIDLYGHGYSQQAYSVKSLRHIAKDINKKYNNGFIIGHSMGGYLALELLEIGFKPNGLILCNSTANEDSQLKAKQRAKEIELINKGKAELLKKLFLYDQINSEYLTNLLVNAAKIVNAQTMKEYIEAMLNRPSYAAYIELNNIPRVIIRGAKEDAISVHAVWKTITINNSGHYSFLEKPEETAKAIIKSLLTNN